MSSVTIKLDDKSGMTWTKSGRLLRAVLVVVRSIPWRSILGDLVLVIIWVVTVSFAFRTAGWPMWLYYVIVFAGVIGYSFMDEWWTFRRPH